MPFYIEVDSQGNSINHPIEENNLLAHLGIGNPNIIPLDKYQPFERLQPPEIESFEYYTVTYQKRPDGVWTDVFEIHELTREEYLQFLNETNPNGGKPYPSWILSEDYSTWLPPVPYPEDGQNYVWNENELKWDLTTI